MTRIFAIFSSPLWLAMLPFHPPPDPREPYESHGGTAQLIDGQWYHWHINRRPEFECDYLSDAMRNMRIEQL